MSNHDHPCRGCGDDLRLIGSAHEADCLARKLDACQHDLKQAGQWLAESGATNQKLQSRLASAENRWKLAMRRLQERFGDGLAVHKADIEALLAQLAEHDASNVGVAVEAQQQDQEKAD